MRTTATRVLGLAVLFVLAGCAGGASPDKLPGDAGHDAPADAPADAESPDGGDCGGLAWKTPACAACTHQNCCSVEELCAAIPSCAPLDACWNACGADAGCTNGCGSQYVAAVSNYHAILNCQHNACAAACASP
jgi:hypothetical protein